MRYVIAILMLSATVCSAASIVDDADGIPHVINEETPRDGEVSVELRELWRAGGDDEDLLIGTIASLLTDAAGNVYALDGQLSQIQIFDPDGGHLDTIGRQGEGPGEFVNGATMYWSPGGEIGVIQGWPGKIVLLNTDGTPGSQYAIPYEGGGFQAASRGVGVGGTVVLSGSAWVTRDGGQRQQSYLKAYDMEGAEVAHYHLEDKATSFGGFTFQETSYRDFQQRWTAAADGRVAAALTFDDYVIHVWNPGGDLDRIIERPDHRPAARDDDEMSLLQEVYDRVVSWNPDATFEVSPVHEVVGGVQFRGDGSLWVQSGRDQWRTPAGVLTGYDVYDREGVYARRVNLIADGDASDDGVFLLDDRVYVVTDMYSALMMTLGIEGAGDEEVEPVSVIAYAADLP